MEFLIYGLFDNYFVLQVVSEEGLKIFLLERKFLLLNVIKDDEVLYSELFI